MPVECLGAHLNDPEQRPRDDTEGDLTGIRKVRHPQRMSDLEV